LVGDMWPFASGYAKLSTIKTKFKSVTDSSMALRCFGAVIAAAGFCTERKLALL